jgi:hypothetical protein
LNPGMFWPDDERCLLSGKGCHTQLLQQVGGGGGRPGLLCLVKVFAGFENTA